MLRLVEYPITVAETASYQKDADELLTTEQHDRLRDCLAFHPLQGDEIAGAGGIRQLFWPFKDKGKERVAQVIYFYRDLHVPLYLLAIYAEAKPVEFDDSWRGEMSQLANMLVREHGRGTTPRAAPDSTAKPA